MSSGKVEELKDEIVSLKEQLGYAKLEIDTLKDINEKQGMRENDFRGIINKIISMVSGSPITQTSMDLLIENLKREGMVFMPKSGVLQIV